MDIVVSDRPVVVTVAFARTSAITTCGLPFTRRFVQRAFIEQA
jgi:hypothetical protein